MADEILRRDQNRITVLAGITDDADQDIVMFRIDPISKRLKIAIDPASITTDWGEIGGTLSDQTDLQNALDSKLGETFESVSKNRQDILPQVQSQQIYQHLQTM